MEKGYITYDKIRKHLNGDLKKDINILNPLFDNPSFIRDFSIVNKKVYDFQNKVFNFHTSRIKRYKSPYSTDLLQNFMSYLSRNGFEVEFLD